MTHFDILTFTCIARYGRHSVKTVGMGSKPYHCIHCGGKFWFHEGFPARDLQHPIQVIYDEGKYTWLAEGALIRWFRRDY